MRTITAASAMIPSHESTARRKLSRALIAIGALFIVSANACAAEGAADGAGTIKTLTGSGTLFRQSSTMPLKTGQRVFAGDRLVTGRDSYVGVMLQDDTRLTMGPSSELVIREFEFNSSSYAGELTVAFLKGTMRVVTGLIGKQTPERVRFHTPTSTIGIRGTEFIVDIPVE